MKTIYKISKNGLQEETEYQKNIWVHFTNPNESELKEISNTFAISPKDLKKALDKAELPHFETDEDYLFYILPTSNTTKLAKNNYHSRPFGIFLKKQQLITISIEETFLEEEIKSYLESEKAINHPHFILYLISKSTEHFLKNLNEIEEEIIKKEKRIYQATNQDLERMLLLQKSLLYFTTALQGNKMILEKMENQKDLSSIELDFLKNVQIETRQALEMTNTYREILEHTINTYGTMISNNLNDRMKFLTAITLVISIPTMISSFLGMNVFLGEFGKNPYSFILIVLISICLTLILIYILHKKHLL